MVERVTLRSPEGEARYQARIKEGILQNGCRLCVIEPIKEFTHWRIIANEYPYDKIAKVHDMILPKRHVAEDGLTPEELKEYIELKHSYLKDNYQYILEPTYTLKTIPDHFHPHLIVIR